MSATYETRGPIAVITLDNPPVNGLGFETRTAFVAALERANADAAGDFPPFHVDRAIRRLTRDGEALDLTEREFDLAAFLFENHGRVLSRAHLLEAVWRRSADVNTRTVDVHLSRLRRKLGLSGEYGWRLSSIYQHGYRLTSLRDADPAAA